MRKCVFIMAVAVCLAFGGCKGKQEEQATVTVTPDYVPLSSVKDIMDSIVDPNADVVWGAVSETITAKGVETKIPQNDEQWKEVRRHAITLVEATNVLMVPGRHVAKPGEKADSPDVEEPPEAIEAHINRDRATWQDHVHQLRVAALGMLAAVDAKSPDDMGDQADKLDEACEGCHVVYWYPNDKYAKRAYDLSQRNKAK